MPATYSSRPAPKEIQETPTPRRTHSCARSMAAQPGRRYPTYSKYARLALVHHQMAIRRFLLPAGSIAPTAYGDLRTMLDRGSKLATSLSGYLRTLQPSMPIKIPTGPCTSALPVPVALTGLWINLRKDEIPMIDTTGNSEITPVCHRSSASASTSSFIYAGEPPCKFWLPSIELSIDYFRSSE